MRCEVKGTGLSLFGMIWQCHSFLSESLLTNIVIINVTYMITQDYLVTADARDK